MNLKYIILQSLITIVIAIAVSSWMAPQPDSQPSALGSDTGLVTVSEEDIVAISAQDPDFDKQVFVELAKAQQARRGLDQRIVQLQATVSQLQREASLFKGNDGANASISMNTLIDAETGQTDRSAILAQMGLDPSRADQIRQRAEQQDLQRLFLRNRAIREGWMGTERYFNETQKLEAETDVYLKELGKTDYDRFLYLSGENNRVSIASVMAGSPAETAGMQPGDVILDYGNKSIFSWTDLTSATTEGNQGEQVSVRLQRGNSTLNVFIPRGPLGVRLDTMRVEPG